MVDVGFAFAAWNGVSVLVDDAVGGCTAGNDCLTRTMRCCLVVLAIEPGEKHAQARKGPPDGTEPVAENGLEGHGEDVEVVVGVIDPVVSVHHVE